MILNFRTGLDAFPYVYTNSASSDPFQALRKMLDRGYEHIGTFKDEFDAQGLALASLDRATGVWSEGIRPDRVAYARSTRVAEKRQAILDWKTEFLANILEHRAYLAAPIPSPRIPSQPRKLSKQYWGSVRDHPKADEGGHQTMARLMRGMLDKIFGKFKKLRRTGRLEKKSDLELFHDTRKQLRAALNLADEFPGTLINAEAHAEMKERLIDLITDMGAIEDQIVALLDTPKRERRGMQREIHESWKALRRDLDRLDVGDLLRDFRRNLLK